MASHNSSIVKTMDSSGNVSYYGSLSACCRDYDIRYEALLVKLIEYGGLAPDGKTFFDYPTTWEIQDIKDKKIILIDMAGSKRK